MKYFLMLMIVLLYGCATQYTGKLPVEFSRDVDQCSMVADIDIKAIDENTFVYRFNPANESRIDACLVARGWRHK